MFVADLSAYPQIGTAFEGIFAEEGGRRCNHQGADDPVHRISLERSLSDQSNGRLPWLPDPNLSHAVDTVFEHPEAAHTVDSPAGCALISRSVFAERFREAIGPTPINFVHNLRIRKAADLLRQTGGPSVEQVAHQVARARAIPLAPSKTHLASSLLRFGRAN
ncbi:MAG TPA: hypothetical protein EYM75_04865 [Dehalococcoidia bacterium]|nr:hypothetical protein [Dehalococcoidia bacterium]